MAGTVWRRLTAVLFPERCVYCDTVLPPFEDVCADCRQTLPRQPRPLCLRCGESKKACTCGNRKSTVDGIAAVFRYEGNVVRGILRFKENGTSLAAAHFAHEMAEAVRQEFPDVAFDAVTFVPMYPAEQRRRGYNHGEWLAEKVAEQLGLSCLPTLQKLFKTKPQKALPLFSRGANLRGALDLASGAAVQDKVLLLVDDVTTSGSTLHECALILKIYGAAAVYAVTLAKTSMKGEDTDGRNQSGD